MIRIVVARLNNIERWRWNSNQSKR